MEKLKLFEKYSESFSGGSSENLYFKFMHWADTQQYENLLHSQLTEKPLETGIISLFQVTVTDTPQNH